MMTKKGCFDKTDLVFKAWSSIRRKTPSEDVQQTLEQPAVNGKGNNLNGERKKKKKK